MVVVVIVVVDVIDADDGSLMAGGGLMLYTSSVPRLVRDARLPYLSHCRCDSFSFAVSIGSTGMVLSR